MTRFRIFPRAGRMSSAFRGTAVSLTVLQALASVPLAASQRTAVAPTEKRISAAPIPLKAVTVNRTVPRVTAPRAAIVFSATPSDQEIFQARVFTEPFVPTGPTTTTENAALAAAITTYAAAPSIDDLAMFEAFVRTHPSSA